MSSTSTSSPGRPSWKGEEDQAPAVIRHRWEANWNEFQDQRYLAPMRRRRWWLALLLLISLSLLGIFVWGLLYTSMKTPVIAVAATQYAWPHTLNPFAFEDLQSLASLDGKILELNDGSTEWESKQRAIHHFEESLRQSEKLSRRSQVLVIYLSLHGAVDETGKAYLIPTDASHLNAATWISVDELLDRIESQTSRSVPCVLVFDCVRELANWESAELYNAFPLRLKETLDRRNVPNLAVMCAADDGEQNWSSADLHASIFGEAFSRGLAGFADQVVSKSNTESESWGGGNADGRVTFLELHRYVKHRVQEWSLTNRGVAQSPWVWQAKDHDFPVSWSLNKRQLKQLQSQSASVGRTPDNIDPEEIARLWQAREGLRAKQLYQADPLGWAELEQQLLRLESLAQAGEAYRESSQRLLVELQTRMRRITERVSDVALQTDVFRRSVCLREVAVERAPRIRTHSLAFAEIIGQVDLADAIPFRELLLTLSRGAEKNSSLALSNFIQKNPELGTTTEANFVLLSRRHHMSEVWAGRDIPQRLTALRDRAERLTVQGDLRLHAWLAPARHTADERRRQAEDAYFAGKPEGIDAALHDWEQSLNALEPNVDGSPASQLNQALSVRDQGYAEAHYLAQWLCHPHADLEKLVDAAQIQVKDTKPSEANAEVDEPLVNYTLMSLIRGLHEVSDRLANARDSSATRISEVLQRADSVKQSQSELNRLVDIWIKTCMSEEQIDPATLRNIEALMTLPNLPWDRRLALKKKASALATNFHEGEHSSQTESTPTGMQTPTAKASYLDRIRSWNEHPCIVLHRIIAPSLSSKPESSSASTSGGELEELKARLKQRIGSYPSLDETLVIDWVRLDELKTSDDQSLEGRVPFAIAEQLARAGAPYRTVSNSASMGVDPIAKLLRFDVQSLLLDYAQRTLDDFYAQPREAGQLTAKDKIPFFDSAVVDLLQGVNVIHEPQLDIETRVKELDALRKVRTATALNGLTVTAHQDLLSPESDNASLRIDITPSALKTSPSTRISTNESPSDRSSEGAGMPMGTAAVFVEADEQLLLQDRATIRLPVASAGANCKLLSPSLPPDTSTLRVVTLFRGHEYATPLVVKQAAGVVVQFEPRQFNEATVTLQGERNERAAILFVLDCSWSMREEISVEAQGPATQPRLTLAKTAMKNLLRQLAARQDSLVGVRLFGHRIAWSRPAVDPTKKDAPPPASRVVTRPDYQGDIPDRLDPGADTELVLPVGRFDSRQANRVEAMLDAVEPWGQSPLYLSLIDGLEDLSAIDEATEKSIVVITDGDNFQFTPNGRSAAPKTSLEEVQRVFKSAKVPVYVLGFGVPDEEAKAVTATFSQVAKSSGGKHYDVDNGADLLTVLQERLTLGGFQVLDPEGNLIVSEAGAKISSRLNGVVPLENVLKAKGPFEIQFQNVRRSFEVQGGERLEIALTSDGQDMVGRPYERELPVSGKMSRTGNADRFTARVHQPFREGRNVTLPISIQNDDRHYTRRPSEVWIEVTPVTSKGEYREQTYPYYDAVYEPGKPVPYLKWVAPNWPSQANKAAVRVWCKDETSVPLFTLPLSDVASDPATYAAGQVLNGVTGVRYRVQYREPTGTTEPFELRIIEEHDESSNGIGSLRVQLEGPERILPKQVIRQFDARGRIAIHTYQYAPEVGRRVSRANDAKIVFVTRAAAHAGCVHLEDDHPILVEILSSVESLPLDAATGRR